MDTEKKKKAKKLCFPCGYKNCNNNPQKTVFVLINVRKTFKGRMRRDQRKAGQKNPAIYTHKKKDVKTFAMICCILFSFHSLYLEHVFYFPILK